MRVLLDTNILLRLLNPSDPEYAIVRAAIDAFVARGDEPCFTSQNLVEFWNVCTRPADKNGFGLSGPETHLRAKLIESKFRLLPDSEQVHTNWRWLVVEYAVAGVQVHDARLVAAMLTHAVSQLLTLNNRDFTRYTGITTVHPRDAAPAVPGR